MIVFCGLSLSVCFSLSASLDSRSAANDGVILWITFHPYNFNTHAATSIISPATVSANTLLYRMVLNTMFVFSADNAVVHDVDKAAVTTHLSIVCSITGFPVTVKNLFVYRGRFRRSRIFSSLHKV
jgi:hypothetical protein